MGAQVRLSRSIIKMEVLVLDSSPSPSSDDRSGGIAGPREAKTSHDITRRRS